MKIENIREDVLEDVRKRGFPDKQIERMDAARIFDEYLSWNGIIGYGDALWNIVLDLHEAEVAEDQEE